MTEYQWQQFEAKFPQAMAFIRNADLVCELVLLRIEREAGHMDGRRKVWVDNRLCELEAMPHIVAQANNQ